MTSAATPTALLCLDFQAGIGDQAYAAQAVQKAASALQAGRGAGVLRVFSKLALRPGDADVAPWNPFFSAAAGKGTFTAASSRIIPELAPAAGEVVIDKARFCAFTGSDLHVVLRSQSIVELVLRGVSTGGVVLATFMTASDEDYRLTVLSDACADPRAALHAELMASVFARSSTVMTVNEWAGSLPRTRP